MGVFPSCFCFLSYVYKTVLITNYNRGCQLAGGQSRVSIAPWQPARWWPLRIIQLHFFKSVYSSQCLNLKCFFYNSSKKACIKVWITYSHSAPDLAERCTTAIGRARGVDGSHLLMALDETQIGRRDWCQPHGKVWGIVAKWVSCMEFSRQVEKQVENLETFRWPKKSVTVTNSVCPSNSSMVLWKPRDDLPVTRHFRKSFPGLIPIKIIVEVLKTLTFLDGFSQNHRLYDCISTLPKFHGFWGPRGWLNEFGNWIIVGFVKTPWSGLHFFGWALSVEFFWLAKPVKLVDFFWLGSIGWIVLAGKPRETGWIFLAR